jgi:hypothetical protein
MSAVETPDNNLYPFLSRALGTNVTAIRRIRKGRNSRVYRVSCETSKDYIAKFYLPTASGGDRDRLQVEFTSLKFLWDNGVTCIPEPLFADTEHQYAVYTCVAGDAILDSGVSETDIDQAVRFLMRLKELSLMDGSRGLPPAGEAWLSLRSAFSTIQVRLQRLQALQDDGPTYDGLQAFLEGEFTPCLREVMDWCTTMARSSGIAIEIELEPRELTLSPSDFGFHNVLRRWDGEVVFLDFEYFGWDDPAKTVSDFLTHPAMDLEVNWKQRFFHGMVEGFGFLESMPRRAEILYPLAGLKWCLLLLNEFVPEHLGRRGFAMRDPLEKAELQHQQLTKSRNMLHWVCRDYQTFPFK